MCFEAGKSHLQLCANLELNALGIFHQIFHRMRTRILYIQHSIGTGRQNPLFSRLGHIKGSQHRRLVTSPKINLKWKHWSKYLMPSIRVSDIAKKRHQHKIRFSFALGKCSLYGGLSHWSSQQMVNTTLSREYLSEFQRSLKSEKWIVRLKSFLWLIHIGDLSNLRLILGLSASLCQVFNFYCICVRENDH